MQEILRGRGDPRRKRVTLLQPLTPAEEAALHTLQAQLQTLAVRLSRAGHHALEAGLGVPAATLQKQALRARAEHHYPSLLIQRRTPTALATAPAPQPPLTTEMAGSRRRLRSIPATLGRITLDPEDAAAIQAAWQTIDATLTAHQTPGASRPPQETTL